MSALATLSENFSRRTGIVVEQELQPDLPALSEETELAVYRVAQEALTNVARHAQAPSAPICSCSTAPGG